MSGQQAVKKPETTRGTHSHAHALIGFLLRQDRKAVEAALGTPFRKGEPSDDKQWCAYHVPDSEKNYLVVFYYAGKDPNSKDKIIEMELTGTDPSGPTGFFGLQLGDSAEKVEAVLGKPTKISHEDDVNVDLWDYESNNYSLEFSPDRTLFSIQILDQNEENPPDPAGSKEVRLFAQAIHTRNIDTIMDMVSGEIECSWPKDFFSTGSGPARGVLSNPKSGISVCLRRAADAVLALGPQMKGAGDQIRIWTNHSPGTVTKFPASSPLKEIVFDQEAGAWRVYEVTFR